MRFDLVRPCKNCPFRVDCLPGWLGRERATEIADALLDERPGLTFACHETTEFTEDDEGEALYTPKGGEQHCAGAMVLVDREGVANQMLQIAERFDLRNPETIVTTSEALVFTDRDAFIDHHSQERGANGKH